MNINVKIIEKEGVIKYRAAVLHSILLQEFGKTIQKKISITKTMKKYNLPVSTLYHLLNELELLNLVKIDGKYITIKDSTNYDEYNIDSTLLSEFELDFDIIILYLQYYMLKKYNTENDNKLANYMYYCIKNSQENFITKKELKTYVKNFNTKSFLEKAAEINLGFYKKDINNIMFYGTLSVANCADCLKVDIKNTAPKILQKLENMNLITLEKWNCSVVGNLPRKVKFNL
jgi:hypothetical protein